MKIFTTKQIAEIDRYTIKNEPISDIDLMERASAQMAIWIQNHFSNYHKIVVFAGPGNNGGDALAIARMLADKDYSVEVFFLDFGKPLKGSPQKNWQRLEQQGKVKLCKIKEEKDIPEMKKGSVILDGLFGSGLSRPLEGLPAEIVKRINECMDCSHTTLSGVTTSIISVDIPSGLMGEDNSKNIPENIVRADYTLTLQFPKVSFFFPENESCLGKWEVLPIGLHPDGIRQTQTPYHLTSFERVQEIFPQRSKFGHKGTMGHALLIAGSYGKTGAAILASRACLHAGVGLLTTHIPRTGYQIIQTAVPEAMASIDPSDLMFTEFPDTESFTSIGIGPGLGTKPNTKRALYKLIEQSSKPLVIDADALNILAEHPEWLEEIPDHSILTPHPGEFRRLVGDWENSWQRLQKVQTFAKKNSVVVVLKGAYTTIATPGGELLFNPTGNPGMATAGSGDALTGILLGLLAQGIPPDETAISGVYLHGLAADLAAKEVSQEALTAGTIIDYLGKAFLKIKPSEEQ